MRREAAWTMLAAFTASGPALAAEFVKGPWLQDVTGDAATVMWEGDGVEAAFVDYGPTAGYGSSVAATSADVNGHPVYSARIEGLDPGTSYHYRARMGSTETTDATLRTAGDSGFRFYAVGDSRSNPPVWGAICRMIHEDMERHPDRSQTFIVNTGDIAEDGSSYAEWDQMFPPCREALREMPFYVSLGNHEDQGTDASDAFIDGYFAFPGSDLRWFSFRWAGVHVAAISQYADEGWDSGTQYDWLVADLQAAMDDPSVDWTVALMHFTPWSLGDHGEADAADLREILHPVFVDAGADLVLGGHNHLYARYAPVDGVTYLTTGGGGAGLHDGGPYEGWSGAVLESQASIHHFCIVDVEGDVVAIRALDLGGSVFDWVTLGGTDTDRPPVAFAGPDSRANVGDAVTLDGSGSRDPEGTPLSYAWTQVEGPVVALSGADTAGPSFTPGEEGRCIFELAAFDGAFASAPDFTVVDVFGGSASASPVADTHVDASEPATGHGSAATLLLDLGPSYSPLDTQHVYLRFDVSGVAGSVASARLRLWCTNSGSTATIRTSSDTGWDEDGPTWDSPLAEDGPIVGSLDPAVEEEWVEADVTAGVAGDGPVTFVLLPTGTDGADFSSKEGSHAPELVVSWSEESLLACSASADAASAGTGESVAFTGHATGGETIVSWEWDFSSEPFSFTPEAEGQTVTHAFDAPGTYDVALRVEDASERVCLSTLRIEVVDGSPGSEGCGCAIVR